MKRKRILPIHVGGTIACAQSESGFKPNLAFADLLNKINKNFTGDCLIGEAQTPFGKYGIDSARMQIPHIQKIAQTICAHYNQYDAFLITHGTDTLAYTASMLAFILQGIQKTVIITGAQKTLEDDESDVIANLETAMTASSTNNCGVWVAFNKKVIKAVRATKIDIGVNNIDAFASNIGNEIKISDFQTNDHAVNKGQLETFRPEVSEAIDIFCLTHTTNPTRLRDYLASTDLKALIILIYGMSGHRLELMEILSRWANDNKTVVIAKSHSPYGSTDLSKYESGIKALKMGIISSLDMTLESIYAKTCHLLTLTATPQEFRRQFYLNYCGELDETKVEQFQKKSNYWLSTT